MAGRVIISSLTREAAKQLVKDIGPVVWAGVQLWNLYRDGKASEQQQQAFKAMEDTVPKLLDRVESKEIRVVPGAFNSSDGYIAKFQTAALVSIALVILDIDNAIKRIDASLKAIRNELAISNVAKIQGWEKDGFGVHVYRFVRNEMLQVTRQSQKQKESVGTQRHHYFYVWHPDNDWYPLFEERNEENPLGPEFGGYHHDLLTICSRMRTDRDTLVQETTYGRTAEFHLLIPAYSPLVIDNPIAFHDSLLPLTITGQRHRQVDFVWLELHQRSQRLGLSCIGILKPEHNPVMKAAGVSYLACWTLAMTSGIASAVFPPCAPVAGSIFCASWTGGVTSWFTFVGAHIHDSVNYKETCVLGCPLFHAPESG
ncbi:hypothetical protein DTO271G3_1349 [Paecilomyces variotii]|nr:hypothetical protein DTO271G3_1349 [Paecilomyces variotii]